MNKTVGKYTRMQVASCLVGYLVTCLRVYCSKVETNYIKTGLIYLRM